MQCWGLDVFVWEVRQMKGVKARVGWPCFQATDLQLPSGPASRAVSLPGSACRLAVPCFPLQVRCPIPVFLPIQRGSYFCLEENARPLPRVSVRERGEREREGGR